MLKKREIMNNDDRKIIKNSHEDSDFVKNILGVLDSVGEVGFLPHGNSMWPFIKNASKPVVIRKKKENEIFKPFDVILYKRENVGLVLHRVMSVENDHYVVRGDSQYYFEKVYFNNVYGVMIGFYKGKKFISSENPKTLKKVKRWHKDRLLKKIALKLFYTREKFFGKSKNVVKK